MAEAAKALKAEKTIAITDPQAQAISHYLSAAGWMAAPESVSMWLSAFMVTFYEVAGAFALIVARATGGSGQPLTPAPTANQAVARPEARQTDTDGDGDDSSPEDPPSPPQPRGRPGRRPTVLAEEAVAKLRESGGKANGTISGIGRLIGTRSKTTAHRVLHQLADAGLIRLSASPAGVQVALA